MEEEELVKLLQTARRNNERLGVTGMLLYKDGNFMQTLEGSNESLMELIDSISKDPRHRGVLRLIKKDLIERCFANWSMAFQNLDAISPEDLAAFSPFLAGSLLDYSFLQQPESCYRLMLSFKKSMK